MKIITLVENTSRCGCKSAHGLSFYIETVGHKILFDLGPDETLFYNAQNKNVDLKQIDTVIISHGHSDHGGALKQFLEFNPIAKIYIRQSAFEKHYSHSGLKDISLDESLKNHPNVILLNQDTKIDDELFLFTAKTRDSNPSEANNTLYSSCGPDDFRHEQNLLIFENKTVLFMGCGHSGVVNILENAGLQPDYCFGGFHLYNPGLQKTVSQTQLETVSRELEKYNSVNFYTCHCTGIEAFNYLSRNHDNIKYISCGEEITI